MRNRREERFQRFIRQNVAHLARACWLAAAWQESNWDAHRDCDIGLAASCLRDSKKFLRTEKILKRYAVLMERQVAEMKGTK
jgi:hypothetical protein